jgi:lipopolysaccharide biosynthesis protein
MKKIKSYIVSVLILIWDDPTLARLFWAIYTFALRRVGIRERWSPTFAFQEFDSSTLEFPKEKRIALVAHLFYLEGVKDFFNSVDSFPDGSSVFVSVASEEAKRQVEVAASLQAKRVHVSVAENRGRNMQPLFVVFGVELLGFDYIFHVHTKKSLHSKKLGEAWNDRLWRSLISDISIVKRTLNLMERDNELVISYPWVCDLVPSANFRWGSNKKTAENLLERLGLSTPLNARVQFPFPAGGMFVMTGQYFAQIHAMNLALSDFPEELGQIDGTTQHAIERIIGYYAEIQGLKHLVYHSALDSFTSDTSYFEIERDTWKKIFSRHPKSLE